MSLPRVGLSLSTLNRRDLFTATLEQFRRYTPAEFPIVVVDDGSDVPVPAVEGVTVIRNPAPIGVAGVKNQGLAALMDLGCDYLVLYDDDCHPTEFGWERPYIESGEHSLSHQPTKADFCRVCRRTTNWAYAVRLGRFTCEAHEPRVEIYRDDVIRAVEWGSGAMQFFTRHAIETAGGFRPEYGRWSCEHWDMAYRMHNLGLCRYPFADVLDPKLYARDAYTTGYRSSVSQDVRAEHRQRNFSLFNEHKDSTEYVDYREGVPSK